MINIWPTYLFSVKKKVISEYAGIQQGYLFSFHLAVALRIIHSVEPWNLLRSVPFIIVLPRSSFLGCRRCRRSTSWFSNVQDPNYI